MLRNVVVENEREGEEAAQLKVEEGMWYGMEIRESWFDFILSFSLRVLLLKLGEKGKEVFAERAIATLGKLEAWILGFATIRANCNDEGLQCKVGVEVLLFKHVLVFFPQLR